MKSKQLSLGLLLIGDAFTLGVVTIIGFASHDTLGSAGFRIMATFLPLLTAWVLVSLHLGTYDLACASKANQLWRPAWAMILAAPLAAWLRGLWLGSPILPIFVLVIAGSSAAGMLIWRSIFLILRSKSGQSDG
ncbi:MAG: DUF3054 domain-containing protein [Anaerolineales bacterium]